MSTDPIVRRAVRGLLVLFAAAAAACAHRPGAAARASADEAELRSFYSRFVTDMYRKRLDPALLAIMAPDFEQHTIGPNGATRVSSRADFISSITRSVAALDSVGEFTIDVTRVETAGDSAVVRYREKMVLFQRAPQAGAPPNRYADESWWADRWVRTPEGWRVVRFVEVPRP